MIICLTKLIDYITKPRDVIQQQKTLTKLYEEFQTERVGALDAMLASTPDIGNKLAMAECQCQRWRDYAHQLEKLCLSAGLPIPASPSE